MAPENVHDFFLASAWGTVRDGVFLVGLAAVFIIQLVTGLAINRQPDNAGAVNTIAILVVACFLVGISRRGS